jgi:parallel beta-helix repeat protein
MSTHRFRIKADVALKALNEVVEAAATIDQSVARMETDITLADDSLLADLTIFMEQQGYEFVVSTPATSLANRYPDPSGNLWGIRVKDDDGNWQSEDPTGPVTTFPPVFEAASEPSGWPNKWPTPPNSTISVVDGTRTFTVTYLAGGENLWVRGDRIPKAAGSESVVWPDVEGTHFFYYDTSGVLQTTQTFDVWVAALLGDGVLVSALYWDQANSLHIRFLEERHGFMPGPTHLEFHQAFGAQWPQNGGGALGSFTIGDGSLDSHAEWDIATATIYDEDVRLTFSDGSPQTIAFPAQIPMFYLSGATPVWRKAAADNFPMIQNGKAGYVGTRLAYNQFTGGAWQFTEVSNNDYVLTHIFLTNDVEEPFIGIVGQNDYATLGDAQDGAEVEIATLAGLAPLLGQEFTPLGTVILQTNTTYGNTPKARVVQTAAGGNYIDFRGQSTKGTSVVQAVTSVFGRVGAVVAQSGDYSAFYPFKMYDAVVDAAGGGDYLLPSAAFTAGATQVFIRSGTYNETTDVTLPDGGRLVGEGEVVINFTGAFGVRNVVPGGSWSTGTITATSGSAIITGIGTNWLGSPILPGWYIRIGNVYYEIASVDSAIQITLVKPYEGNTISTGISYLATPLAERVSLENVRVTGSSSNGVLFQKALDVRVERVQADNCANYGCSIDDCSEIVVAGCVFEDNAGLYGLVVEDCTIVAISDCQATNNTQTGMVVNRCNAAHITNVVCDNNGGTGIGISNTDGASLVGCSALRNSSVGISVSGSGGGVALYGCVARYSGSFNMDVNADEARIVSCTASDGGNIGLRVTTNSGVVANCYIENNTFAGLQVTSTTAIIGNECNNNLFGIDLTISAQRTVVVGNRVNNNTLWGIRNQANVCFFDANLFNGNGSGEITNSTSLTRFGVSARDRTDLVQGHIDNVLSLTYDSEGNDGTGGSTNIDFDLQQNRRYTVNTSPVNLSLDTPQGVGHFQLKLATTGAHTINWTTAITWTQGSAPTFTGANTRFINFYWDGSAWYGQYTDEF